jgi:hypothetical protein
MGLTLVILWHAHREQVVEKILSRPANQDLAVDGRATVLVE